MSVSGTEKARLSKDLLSELDSLFSFGRIVADIRKPMPPYNLLFGHLLVVGKVMSKLPSDLHNQCLPGLLRHAYPNLAQLFTWIHGHSAHLYSLSDLQRFIRLHKNILFQSTPIYVISCVHFQMDWI